MGYPILKNNLTPTLYFRAYKLSDGLPKTGLVYTSSGLAARYTPNRGVSTAITLATLASANSAYSSGGFKEVDPTNDPGLYRIDAPVAAAAGDVGFALTIRDTGSSLDLDTVSDFFPISDIETAKRGTVTNAAFSPTQFEFECADITDAGTDHWKNRAVIVPDGARKGMLGGGITAYSLVSGRGHFTVEGFPASLVNGDPIVIF
jgi:hypothetical protein